MTNFQQLFLTVLLICLTQGLSGGVSGAELPVPPADEIVLLWSEIPAGRAATDQPEQDITKPTDRLIAGQRIIKLADVNQPELHIYHPSLKTSDATFVICPGGGFNILAWDLEGTEVAAWLNSLGMTACVLKYRVPSPPGDERWKPPVQDAQRALSLVRQRASQWKLDTNRIGILGFSAGGKTAALAATLTTRQYTATDAADEFTCRPDLAVLIYPAYLANQEQTELHPDTIVTSQTPATFLVHAFDDRLPLNGSLLFMEALKKQNIPSELHIYDTGGHGYGLRNIPEQPVTRWPIACAEWLKRLQWVTQTTSR